MSSRATVIKLTKDNYQDYHLHDVIAISIATSNSMGDSGAYEIVSSDGVIYHANPYYEDISMEQVVHVCPFISDSQLDYFLDEPRGWKRFNMGYGNFLFIRDSIIEQFQLCINKLELIPYNGLYVYDNWKEIVLDIVDVNRIVDNKGNKYE